jgi:hypothetical protein
VALGDTAVCGPDSDDLAPVPGIMLGRTVPLGELFEPAFDALRTDV